MADALSQCMYLRAVGELPGIDTVKEANKTVSLDNMVVTSCKWIVYMHTVQNLFFVPLDMPVYVETLEESLTAIHAEACDEEPSSWHWSARQAMALNDASDEPTLRFYRYRIVVLPRTKRAGEDVDRGFYDSFARMRTNVTDAEEDLDVVHKLIAARSNRWPLEYDPPLPIVQVSTPSLVFRHLLIMTRTAAALADQSRSCLHHGNRRGRRLLEAQSGAARMAQRSRLLFAPRRDRLTLVLAQV